MALPKQKTPRSHTRSRRFHWRMTAPTLVACANAQCGKPRPPHAACPHCGYYKGAQVIRVKAAKE